MKSIALIVIYLGFVLLPLALSAIVGGPPRPFRQELASGLGMAAFAMILAEFVLSGRFRSVSRGVGMDVTMRFHQLMARTALAFALVHPFLYTGSPAGGARPWDPTREMSLTTEFLPISTGIVAFLLLPTLVALAIGRAKLDYTYETWRLMHGVGALVIAAALLHHTIYAGRYGGTPVMAWTWGAMTALAGATLIWVYLIEPLRDRAHPWKITGLRRETPDQWIMTLAPDGHRGLDYKAGHFAWLTVGHGPFSLHENPFSIASAPAEGPEVRFLIRELGDFTSSLDQVAVGTRAYLDAPYGSLTVDGRDEPGIMLIGGGVGVAPLLGILAELRATGDPREVRLIYGNRIESQIACRDVLDGADVTYVLSEPPDGWTGETGLVDAALIDRVVGDDEAANWLFVMCGPLAMMETVESHLISRGTPASRILSERFDYD